MKKAALHLIAVLFLVATSAFGFTADDVLGSWNVEDGSSRIEIFRCGDRYCGKVVWLKDPLFKADEKPDQVGQPRVDWKNPNATMRTRKLLGLQIMEGFTWIGEGVWDHGRIYDPKSGNTYKGKITMVAKDRLFLKGYVGIPLFGRSTTWTR